jgi:hypothetical protein
MHNVRDQRDWFGPEQRLRKKLEVIRMAMNRKNMKRLTWYGFITLTCLCLLLAHSQCMLGQVDQGAINGTVTDETGAILPNAHVTLLNTDQGLSLETNTNSSGVYIFSPVRIGHYSVTVTLQVSLLRLRRT